MIALALWTALSAALAQPAPDALDPAPTQVDPAPLTVQRAVLDNGLQVWCEPRPGAQSVATMLAIRAGSRYEDLETSGLSHFLEHMVFTGTERWDESEIKREIQDRGGRWNGWTGPERTRYFAHVAADDLEPALVWLDQIVFHPTLPADKIEKERDVVFRERDGRHGWVVNWLDANGFGYLARLELRRALFPGSSMGLRVAGEDASLEAATREQMVDYLAAHYSPRNAALIAVGAVEMSELLPMVQEIFGGVAPGARPDPPATPGPPALDRSPIVRGPMATDESTARVGIRTVGRAHPDRWALDVLAQALQFELMADIRYDRGLVYELSFQPVLFDDAGFLSFYARASDADIEPILEILDGHLDRAHALDPAAIERAKSALIGRWALSMEDAPGRASWLARWSSLLGPDDPVPDYTAKIQAVTPEDVTRVAQTWLGPEDRLVGGHRPVATAAGIAAWGAGGLAAIALLLGIRRYRRRA